MKKRFTILMATIMTFAATITAVADTSAVISQENSADKGYVEGVYCEKNALPKGEYIVFAKEGAIGSYAVFDKFENEYVYKESFTYATIVRVDNDELTTSTIVENATAYPIDSVDTLDLSQNGVFRVGKDIPSGTYMFKKADAGFGYVDNFYMGTKNMRKKEVLHENKDSVYVTLMPNSYLVKINCDIYKNGELYAKASEGKTTDDESLDVVSGELKKQVDESLKVFEQSLSINKVNAEMTSEAYINKLYKYWKPYILNDNDKKYADSIYEALNVVSDYYEIISKVGEYNYLPDGEVYVAKGLEKDFQKLRTAKSFVDIDNTTDVIVSYVTEITNNIVNSRVNYKFGY